MQTSSVSNVWINGKRVLDERKLTTIDANELKGVTLEWQKRIEVFQNDRHKQ